MLILLKINLFRTLFFSFKFLILFLVSLSCAEFNSKTNSKKPKITFTEFIQLPDFGNFLSELGKIANNPKGSPNANPKPSIPIDNCKAPPSDVSEPTSKEPKIGPVHEKETIANVNAIKKIPIKVFNDEELSVRILQDVGRVNS